ncbi:hypothetical protein ACHAXA_007065 [Cyclostephanos tholiformis]|uniref:Sulfotransferase domain-containing protein n=1 Tax=Cyclostephanos tholiformis TaxID=382380 RepID=A0ABD3RCT1_9STRA
MKIPHLMSSKPRIQYNRSQGPKRKLDFLIAGFPKCGTTTLSYAFEAHNGTDISIKERCDIRGKKGLDGPEYANLQDVIGDLSADPKIKRGVKCPNSLKCHRTLSMLTLHSPETKLIIGVRHPVRFLESFYNYRIVEMYSKYPNEMNTSDGLKRPIPPLETLTGGKVWLGVTTQNARFEVFLSQLGKTAVTLEEIENLKVVQNMAVVPNSFKVFLYSLDQLEDANTTRREGFVRELESFLELKYPLNIGHANKNHFVGRNAYKELINICESKYDELRDELVSQGGESQIWLRDNFLESADVIVANRGHFLQTIHAWQSDPCADIV